MHSKIINPRLHGSAVYENKGSCKSLVAYLQHETKAGREPLYFFDQEAEGIPAKEVQQSIDNNGRGLRKGESRFVSLVLSPSEEELLHIGNDREKLKQFTRQVMRQYAGNFHLKGGRKLGAGDLLWFAAIHRERAFKGRTPEANQGLKPALNMHVHVIVSKRDQAQKHTLSPFGNRERFDMQVWQKENQQCFNSMFNFQSKAKATELKLPEAGRLARQHAYIAEKVRTINLYLDKPHQLKLDEVLAVAEKRAYQRTYFYNLIRLEEMLKNKGYVRDPMHLLEHNRDRQRPMDQSRVDNTLASSLRQLANASKSMGYTEDLSLLELSSGRLRRKGLQRS